MVAATADRNTVALLDDLRNAPLAAAVKVFMGRNLDRGLMRNASGYLTKGATAVGCFGVGRAEAPVDNSAGAAGALNINWRHD